MARAELYSQLPKLLKRLFLLGVPCATVFLAIWYFGGYNVWGRFLTLFLNIVAPFAPLRFEAGSSSLAGFVYSFVLEDGRPGELTFLVNQLNSVLVELVTLLAIWPHRHRKAFFQLLGLCLISVMFYQAFSILVQLHVMEIGPAVAGKYEVYWEDSFWYQTVKNISAFDKFLLRFWAGFPIFFFAVALLHFFTRGSEAESQTKKAAKKKNK